MKKIIASATIAATLMGGGLALSQTIAGAQEETSAQSEAPSWVEDALAGLVADGTLTEAQVDAVAEALRNARPQPMHKDGGPGGHGAPAILEELGLDPEVVREGLRNGMSLGEIAEANGISADDLVQALIDAHSERLAEAVESGRIDAEKAAELEAEFAEKAQAIVDGTAELRPAHRHRHRHPHRGHFGDGGQTEDEGVVS